MLRSPFDENKTSKGFSRLDRKNLSNGVDHGSGLKPTLLIRLTINSS